MELGLLKLEVDISLLATLPLTYEHINLSVELLDRHKHCQEQHIYKHVQAEQSHPHQLTNGLEDVRWDIIACQFQSR